MTAAALLTLERLSVDRLGRQVLTDISLSFAKRTLTAVVGPSGVGKSTLLSALNGLLRPATGSIVACGVGRLNSPGALRAWRRQSATVFQDHALIGRLSALDNVLLGLADQRHPLSLLPWSRAMRERAALALADVGLLTRAGTRVEQLSGGERQRVGIARALVRRPALLLGDEPFASVDAHLAQGLASDLRTLVTRHGVTVVIVLHQLQMARALADRIVGLAHGRVVFDGPATAFDTGAEARVFHFSGCGRPHHVS